MTSRGRELGPSPFSSVDWSSAGRRLAAAPLVGARWPFLERGSGELARASVAIRPLNRAHRSVAVRDRCSCCCVCCESGCLTWIYGDRARGRRGGRRASCNGARWPRGRSSSPSPRDDRGRDDSGQATSTFAPITPQPPAGRSAPAWPLCGRGTASRRLEVHDH